MHDLKQMSIQHPFMAPSKLINEVKCKYSKEVCQALPENANLSRSIRKWRQPLDVTEPKTRAEINMSEDQKQDKEGNNFFI